MDADRIIRERAAHGIVTRAQLLRAGLSPDQIDHRIRNGSLEVLFRGVYRVGPVIDPFGRYLAAAWACRGRASDHSGAVVWGLLKPRERLAAHVTVAGGHKQRPGIRVHRRQLARDEVTRRDGIPVTTVARTLLDLAATEPPKVVEEALAEALSRKLVRESQIRRLCARYPTSHGAIRMLRILDGGPLRLRSDDEKHFRAFLKGARLPLPEANVYVEGLEVDFLWRKERLIVETDSLRFHRTRAAFRRDRERDAILVPAGYRVLRIVWEQIEQEPVAIAVAITKLLLQPW